MLERELQDYLYENPDVLFPGQTISRKRREVFLEGRRIDLLFEINGIHYIIELKRDTIRREDIGQIFEYYGLMRQSDAMADFKMVLVAPSIPAYRRIPLEEFGIRCVEVSYQPESIEGLTNGWEGAESERRRPAAQPLSKPFLMPDRLNFEDLLPPATPASVELSQLLLREGLTFVQKAFSEYEVVPVKMLNYQNPGVLCFPDGDSHSPFTGGGAWWAFSFGQSDEMPKNDVPNISVNALPWGLDFAINAELLTSQKVMRQRIESLPERFDHLVAEHGALEFQAWLKFEHQPRIYHWIALPRLSPGTWSARDLLDLYRRSEINFAELRTHYLAWIKEQRSELTCGQIAHMERSNRKLNLALRLVHSFAKEDPLWGQSYDEQQAQFQTEYEKLKPLIDFFQ